jgi:regulator of protease activity HflC (stomatin/prohibitin superfamily)
MVAFTKRGIMIQNFPIKDTEKGILTRHGRFIRILETGSNTVYGTGYAVERFPLETRFEHGLTSFLLERRSDVVTKHFERIQTSLLEVALMTRGDEILDVIAPNSQALFWKGFAALKIVYLNIASGVLLETGAVLAQVRNKAILTRYFTEVAPAALQFAIVTRGGVIQDLVQSGERRIYWRGLEDIATALQAVAAPIAKNVAEAILAKNPVWLEQFRRLELSDTQIAIIRRGAAIVSAFAPSSNTLVMLDGATKVEILETSDLNVPQTLAKNAKGTPLETFIEYALVPEYHQGALFLDGKLERPLEVGVHAFWKTGRSVRVAATDLRLQVLEVGGQEILTKDKVALRVNLTASYRVLEPLQAFAQVTDFVGFLYKELQFALRSVIGTKTLDTLLEEKTALDSDIASIVRPKLEALTLQLESVGVKDIILPGEMKTILSKVVEAEKQAQANLIRRREETAATRNLLNTAKVMEDNPVALRLKELEALERIIEKVQTLTVTNGLDGVLNDLVRIRK